MLNLPPLDFTDVSILLAIGAILLLITTLALPAFYPSFGITMDKRKLDIAAIVTGIIFMITVCMRVFEIIISR